MDVREARLRWEWWVLAACCAVSLCVQLFRPMARPASEPAEEGVFLPIVMYHSLLKDPARANSYTVSPAVFERDLTYLLDKGYRTVVVQDLIDHVQTGAPLPEKPVMITFDDGHLNNLTYALPILQAHGARAVVSVVGAYVEEAVRENDPNPMYAYLTWDDLRELYRSGCFEIQNHSFGLHQNKGARGATRREGEVLARYQQRLIDDVLKMQQAVLENVGWQPTAFTYPFGYIDKDGEQVLRELGFQATLTCAEHGNRITRDPSSLYLLGRYNRPSGMSTDRFMKKLLKQAPGL